MPSDTVPSHIKMDAALGQKLLKRGASMKRVWELLLPVRVEGITTEAKVPVYVFAVIAVISLARGCVHLFAPDGGAHSIAGMRLPADGAGEIVFAFGLWGSSQLVYALVQMAVAFRYKAFVPAMYALLILEVLLRMLVGRIKPVQFVRVPPGAVGNYVILPLALLMLGICIWPRRKRSGE